MSEAKEFRARVEKISRDTIKGMLGEPEIKRIIRSIVIDQQRPETTTATKPKSAERAVKKTPNKG